MRATPRIQLRECCFCILAPLPCGFEAVNGHPARESPPIKGLAKLEIAVQSSPNRVTAPETALGRGKMGIGDARQSPETFQKPTVA